MHFLRRVFAFFVFVVAILRQEIGWFDRDENNSSLLASRLAIHAVAVRTAIGDRMSMVLQSLAVIGGAFGLAFYFQPRLAAVLLCSYPLMIGGFVGEVCSKNPTKLLEDFEFWKICKCFVITDGICLLIRASALRKAQLLSGVKSTA